MRPQKIQHSQDVWEQEQVLLIGKFSGLKVNSASKLRSYHGQVPSKTESYIKSFYISFEWSPFKGA